MERGRRGPEGASGASAGTREGSTCRQNPRFFLQAHLQNHSSAQLCSSRIPRAPAGADTGAESRGRTLMNTALSSPPGGALSHS